MAANLSDPVFGRVFPDLDRAIAGQAPDAPLGEVRDAALVVLYRLLVILYAEDRDLLPVREGDEIVVRPNVFARKGSGSYYTPDELVGLILEETIGPLVRARLEAFATETEKLRKSRRRLRFRLTELKRLDPASRLLDLKVCDPAMGSGHFLTILPADVDCESLPRAGRRDRRGRHSVHPSGLDGTRASRPPGVYRTDNGSGAAAFGRETSSATSLFMA